MRENSMYIGFDLDNTLFKPNARINEYIRSYACRRAGEILGKPYEEVRATYNELYEKCQSSRGSLRAMGIEDVDTIMQNSLEQEEIVELLERDDALNAMLHRLAARYPLYLITTNSREVTVKKLDKLGIDKELFRPMICELETPELTRQNGSAFRHVAHELNAEFAQMFFVGDREKTDIIPAKKLGMTAAIVNGKSDQADYRLEDIYQLEEILSKKTQ